MAINKTITCDRCGKVKREVNHWWIAKINAMDFTLLPWGSGAIESPVAKHLCGQECVSKMASQWMEEKLIPSEEVG
jgi:hypothetical protein